MEVGGKGNNGVIGKKGCGEEREKNEKGREGKVKRKRWGKGKGVWGREKKQWGERKMDVGEKEIMKSDRKRRKRDLGDKEVKGKKCGGMEKK